MQKKAPTADEFAAHRHTTAGISYTDIGSGPVTLFVHGVFTNGNLWRHCVQQLSSERRCISIDLPGHGHTPPLGEPSVWGLADAIGDMIKELDIRDIQLVGNDTGGAICQILVTRWPERFASLALTNCDTEGNFPPPAFRPAVWLAQVNLLRFGAWMARHPRIAKNIYRSGYQKVTAVPDAILESYLKPVFGDRKNLQFVTALLASMHPALLAPIHEQLAACTVPTKIIWGTGDIFFHRKWADWLLHLIPGATQIIEIPHARLFFPDERAAELVEVLRLPVGQAHKKTRQSSHAR